MVIYDGIYRMGAPERLHAGSDLRVDLAWWVRVIDFARSRPGIRYLKPFGVFATPAASRDYLLTCAQGIGRTILDDFNVSVEKVLWVEHFRKDPGHLHVAVFTPASPGGGHAYDTAWRPIRPNELRIIRPFIPEAEFIET